MLKASDINLKKVASKILSKDNIYILCHQYPDGDTIGSALALSLALLQKGKRAKLLCSDKIPNKYSYITNKLEVLNFEPEYIISVDVADEKLLGSNLKKYEKDIDLCIDHHQKNTGYAKETIIDSSAAATAQIIYKLIKEMDVEVTKAIADCIYTGITTDTGCFKYANATEETYLIAADMLKYGASASTINKIMFDTKSIAKIRLEKLIYESLKFYFNNTCATIYLTKSMIEESKAEDDDLDGISSIPRMIAGVKVGVTFREKENNEFKISVRTEGEIDACKICEAFDGGGHKNAAGCSIKGSLSEIEKKLILKIGESLNFSGR